MGSLLASLLKLLISLATLGCAIFIGLKQEPDKELAGRGLFMLGIGLSTFSPFGLFLYVKFWESRPEFSAACGKQAIIGLLCFGCLALLSHAYPAPVDHW